MSRLPTHVEVAGIVRQAATAGDFATILKKGDPERGSLLIVVTSRGRHAGVLERTLSLDGDYRWSVTGPVEPAGSDQIAEFLAKRARFDPDLWTVELDIAEPERFIAETTALG